MVELVIRLVFSLAVVLGMLLLLTRLSAKRFRGGTDALVRVLHRQPLSRTSAVAVVTVGSRVLVVGTTEHQVQLLTELDPEELESAELTASPFAAPAPVEVAAPGAVEVAEPAEMWELTTLDELLGAPADAPVDAAVDAADAYTPRHATRSARSATATQAARAAEGALAGSLLSAQTWRQAFAAATNRPRDAS